MFSRDAAWQALRAWFTDPVTVPVYIALAALSLLAAVGTAFDEIGWTMFVVYLSLSLVSVRAQRPSSST